jgi:hypothetical protein
MMSQVNIQRITEPQHDGAWGTSAALWAGVLLGPAAWGVHLQFVYAAAEQVCKGNLDKTALHIASIACLVVAIASGIIAAWLWFMSGAKWSSDARSDLVARQRFLSCEGILSGVLFAIVIVGQWLSIVYYSPCPP